MRTRGVGSLSRGRFRCTIVQPSGPNRREDVTLSHMEIDGAGIVLKGVSAGRYTIGELYEIELYGTRSKDLGDGVGDGLGLGEGELVANAGQDGGDDGEPGGGGSSGGGGGGGPW